MANDLGLQGDATDAGIEQPASLIAPLSKLGFRDWVALGILIGAVFGFAEAFAWLLLQSFGVPQILWAAPLVNGSLAVAVLLIGALISRVVWRPMVPCVSLYLGCLLVYAPIRVAIGLQVSKLAILDISIPLAALCTYCILRFIVPRKGLYMKGALAAAVIIVLLIGVTAVQFDQLQAQSSEHVPQSDKNVLVIIVDTLRADHMSTAGYPRDTSPHLRQFATRGTIFDVAISASSWTLPAHASLLTGLYPHEHQAIKQRDRLPQGIPVISEWFSEHGYRTGAFSANTVFFSRRSGFGRGFQTFHDSYPPASAVLVATEAGQVIRNFLYEAHLTENLLGRVSGDDVTSDAVSWIDRGPRPFFALLNYMDVHDPYVPPRKYKGRYGEPNSSPSGFGMTLNDFPSLTDAQIRNEVAMYDASISYADEQIDLLLEHLERQGILRNTIVVITSDHGEEFDEHGFFLHGNALYYELVHVPLIIVAPSAPAGTRISAPVSLTSVPATLIDLATGKRSPEFPQDSLATLWRAPEKGSDWPAPASELAQLKFCACFPNYDQSFRSITVGEWHYIAGSKGSEELFNLATDPTNQINLVGSVPSGILAEVKGKLAATTH